MFAVVTVFLVQKNEMAESVKELKDIFIYIVPVLIILSLVGARWYFQKAVSALKNNTDLMGKMTGYRSASIARFALLEGPSLFSIVIFLVTGYWFFLGMAGLMIIVFLIHKPSREKAANDLELSASERLKIEDPDTIIAEFQSH
jgi:hypothetical protein